MIALTIFLAAACIVLLAMLSLQDRRNATLSAENALAKLRMETLGEKLSQRDPQGEDPLTADGMMKAVRHLGYLPDRLEYSIRFMVSGDVFHIVTERIPQVFIFKDFAVDSGEYDIQLMKYAAHLLSDELFMVKATIEDVDDKPDLFNLHFFVAATERTYSSFRENLPVYISLIDESANRLNEIYKDLLEKKKAASIGVHPFMTREQLERKTVS